MPFEGIKAGPPPPREGTKPRAVAPEKRASAKQKAREEAANGVGQILAFGCMVAGQLADAGAIGLHWPNLAHEAAAVAETDEKMGKALDYLLEVGPYGNLIVVTLPLVGQFLANHKIVKAEALAGAGVVHPEALEADVKAEMARRAMAAIQQQREAEQELARMQAEMMAAQNGTQPQQQSEPAND
jgi:hypothetical protein